MKKLLLIFTLLLAAAGVFAQEDSTPGFEMPRAIIKISPFQFAVNTMELSVETFNKTYSKSFNASLAYRSGSVQYSDGSGAGLELGYRKYAAPMKYRERGDRQLYQGIYYSFFVRGEYFKGENNDYYYNYQDTFTEKTLSVIPGFTIGFQRTFWQILVLDVYVGGGVKFTDIEYIDAPPADYEPYYDIADPGYSGIYPKIGAKIGIGL